jgi:hypothetical protein
MNTPSHFLMTAALRQALPRQPMATSAWLLGAVAPDIPLYLLSLGGAIYYRAFLEWTPAATWQQLFGTLYFHHPFWIAAHNVLHSPLLLLLALVSLWPVRSPQGTVWCWLWWFCGACLFHSIVDVLTHVDDGPLILFPFEWTLRFRSPVSYWDSRHYGAEFAIFEVTLDLILLGYLCFPRLWRWLYPSPRGVRMVEEE